ncbi:ABC transporter substrate-binding protein [Halomonas beimenensis]|uniref:Hydroxymethylpyrimidine ABC transporter, substrate-binding component n=1 Tax=Halomonas beimenensis TaxID=475662 RepID=A0A291PCR3_9GAMM|nr:ABC transporter substrate-binding protein [Halomonas beimenensis]ATJ84645.1 hydroxymethylpyrimidine ABC transporter, substrate-binding component [Halomonas beimenensis]
MHRRELLKAMAGLAVAPLGLQACSVGEPLVIGLHPWPGYEPLYLASAFDWLPPSVVLREGRSAGDSLAGLRQGALDGAALTLDEVLKARAEGIPLTVVAVCDDSVGADMVLTRPGIERLSDLEGQRIAVERTAVGNLVLSQLLEASGLSRDQLTLVDMAPDEQLPAWRAGSIDAAVTYEPMATRWRREGAVRLYDSSHFPDVILDVLAMRRDRLRWREGAVKALVAGHFRGLDHLRISPQDAMQRIGAWRGLGFDEVRASYAGLELPGRAGNRDYFGPGGDLMSAARLLNEVMVAEGMLVRPDDLATLMTPRYLPEPGEAV